MLGIEETAYYIPEKRVSNFNRKEKFGIGDEFIRNKIGVEEIAVKSDLENTSDMCIAAYKKLKEKIEINNQDIDVVIVVTQNPDYSIPQTSAILHGVLGFKDECASFDISLGCSGFVYGLSVITSFMKANKFKKGLLFTADPYSKIVDPADKNTSLLFGDAATVTLITENPVFIAQDFVFGTNGACYKDLICENNTLYMNGRGIANFAIKIVPKDILALLERNNLEKEDIDKYLIHQGSKFIVDSLSKKIGLDESKVMYDISLYGNTVSSSIPILIEKIIKDESVDLALGSGFGVGLSWANVLLKRVR
ncbi:MAG TPA: 3-oxoacyl-ACP synthase [Lentisphaeria bacterium]|nr:MAG: 3-oxoacyl-ACP synthase [Lentisphaerae bacterium GWF2_38_69]HBM15455.1 3-oxoacyl-ACP synthase [Lentisphaeria bacterium]